MKAIFILVKGYVHVVQYNDTCGNPYFYARQKLNVSDEEITPWGEFEIKDGVAKFDFNLNA